MKLSSFNTRKKFLIAGSSFAIFSGALITTLVFSSLFIPEQHSHAETKSEALDASDYYLSLSSLSEVSIDLLRTTVEGVVATAEDKITVSTNTSGYKVSLSSADDDENSGKLFMNGDNTLDSIAATSGTAEEPAALDANSWGYAVAGFENFDDDYKSESVDLKSAKFAAVPKLSEADVIATDSWEESGVERVVEHPVIFGVHANSTQAAGTYEGTILYNIASNDSPELSSTKFSPAEVEWASKENETNSFTFTVNVLTMSNMSDGSWSVKFVNADDANDVYACSNVRAELTNNEAGDEPGVKLTCDAPTYLGNGGDAKFKVVATSEKLGEYVAVENFKVIGTGIYGLATMQEMTTAVCSATPTPSEDAEEVAKTLAELKSSINSETRLAGLIPEVELKDSRDNKVYAVRKLANGTCWMNQDLELDLDSEKELNSDDTNIPEGTTFKFEESDNDVNAWNDASKPNYYTVKTADEKYISLVNDEFVFKDKGELSEKRGNLYNFAAASVKSEEKDGVVSGSLCAKGWALPLGSDDSDYKKVFEKLSLVNIEAVEGKEEKNITSKDYIESQLSLIPAGIYDAEEGIKDVRGAGAYWTRSISSENNAYAFTLDSSSSKQGNAEISKKNGLAIRCIAE